ncbi:hypothetical protein CA54_05480 [Symmachiella macrocystis]|uniref:Uncharacterized protein n=1 Tax=Symmachiella macrocystis TaxID=2527985 RepID=A0A5C6BKL2_9PLAN|nr:hypothetical protein CA54_05480 [Symmachiella macrocystis]
MVKDSSETPRNISRFKAFFAGIGDCLPGVLVPVPIMYISLFVMETLGVNTGQMTGVFSILPLLFAWWIVPLCGIGYAVFRINHQRRVAWGTFLFGFLYGGLIPCWILLNQVFAWSF